jgi:hypothetical protein
MNDDQLKRDIEQALSVTPSAGFEARVRAHIAQSGPPALPWLRWGAAAAAFVVFATGFAVWSPKPKENAVQVLQDIPVNAPAIEAVKAARPIALIEPRTIDSATPAPAEPEVLIDPREVAAYRRLIEGSPEKRIDLGKLFELQQAAAKTNAIEEIALMPIGDLDPIAIAPLTVGAPRIEGESL